MQPVKRNISLLGSTGSIGVNTLDIVRRFPDLFNIVGLAAGKKAALLAEQIIEAKPALVSVFGEKEAVELKKLTGPDIDVEIVWGDQGLCRVAAMPEADTVVSAVVGAAGLKPTWAAAQSGKRIALANKETLVMAGELVMAEAARKKAEILPVDSEHSAIFQALSGQNLQDVRRLILTASGGPFRSMDKKDLAVVTRKQALAHPNWNMGPKISIDSATLMNKGLEAIEARWLFGLNWDKIAIHIHPQSIVHSMVEFVDGALLAQMGIPDMRVPIAYALSYPKRLPLDLPFLNLSHSPALTFDDPDLQRFPCLALALEAGRKGGTSPAVLNAANEVAVKAFLDGELSFPDIADVVQKTLLKNGAGPLENLEQVFEADRSARDMAHEIALSIGGGRP